MDQSDRSLSKAFLALRVSQPHVPRGTLGSRRYGTLAATGAAPVERLSSRYRSGCLQCTCNENSTLVGQECENKCRTSPLARGRGGWHDAGLCCCLQLAAPGGLSPLTLAVP